MANLPFECRHYRPLYRDGQPAVSDAALELLASGALVSVGVYGGCCDARVPADYYEGNGRDIGCVGPDHPLCPDPTAPTPLIRPEDIA